MTRFRLRHATRYAYSRRVDLAQHVLHLDARETPVQTVVAAEVACTPQPGSLSRRTDHFGNRVTQVQLAFAHDGFTAELRADGELRPRQIPAPGATPPWEEIAAALDGDGFPEAIEASEFALPSPLVPRLAGLEAFARRIFGARRPVLDGVMALTGAIHETYRYDPAATEVSTPLARVLDLRAGVCQDFAHVQIGALRSLGLAARYVSGYVATRPAPGASALRGADASHAWISVWCGPAVGWVDADPTNDCLVIDRHVVAAWGRDYGDVSPVRGVLSGGGPHRLEVAVDLDLDAGTDTMRPGSARGGG